MRTVLILAFLIFHHMGNAQLIDPFGKIKTHEIKLTKLDNGTYKGALEWTTGGVDSIQRFVVKGLSIKAPVMVRIISKAPTHNIDVSFHKSSWDKIESKVATKGGKFIDKVFRTMNIAGIGVSSEVAGIPYVLIITVGLQFPSTKSLIRITNDIEEYNMYLSKLGMTNNTPAVTNTNDSSTASLPLSQNNPNTLMYVIIGLLGLIVVLLVFFLLRKKQSKNTLTLFLLLCSIGSTLAQNEPKWVPIDGQGNSPVFFEYGRANVANQEPVPLTRPNTRVSTIEVGIGEDGVFRSERFVQIQSNPESTELSEEEYAELQRRMNENDEDFDRDYRENNPGEPTEGDQRTLPVDRTQEQIAQLRREVRQLRRQVEILSQEDQQYNEHDNESTNEEILIFCEQCQTCVDAKALKFIKYHGYVEYLQNFYMSEITSINDQIAHGNSLASVPGAGLGWGNILIHNIRPAVDQLKAAYSDKFDEYMRAMEVTIGELIACIGTSTNQEQINNTMAIQAELMGYLNNLKATKINL